MAELNDKFEFEQDGKTYSLYNLPDGFVIKGDVDISDKGLTKLPDLSKVKVEGDFHCFNNQLTSLQGAPREVGGDFDCENNQLTSLIGAPQEIAGNFHCGDNQLTSLEGAPQKVGYNFRCSDNKLTSLSGGPKEVGEGYYCVKNRLTSLKGAPKKIGENFGCGDNPELTSLVGIPEMPEKDRIYCDDALAKRYDCFKFRDGSIWYKDMVESTAYQNELKIEELRRKKHEDRVKKDTEAKAKRDAGFAAFKKMKSEERE